MERRGQRLHDRSSGHATPSRGVTTPVAPPPTADRSFVQGVRVARAHFERAVIVGAPARASSLPGCRARAGRLVQPCESDIRRRARRLGLVWSMTKFLRRRLPGTSGTRRRGVESARLRCKPPCDDRGRDNPILVQGSSARGKRQPRRQRRLLAVSHHRYVRLRRRGGFPIAERRIRRAPRAPSKSAVRA
jgi:hypothetical protein